MEEGEIEVDYPRSRQRAVSTKSALSGVRPPFRRVAQSLVPPLVEQTRRGEATVSVSRYGAGLLFVEYLDVVNLLSFRIGTGDRQR